ncbi:hypothetical protein CMV_025472 [Castanea mollissima]|uniref:Uncharacterized protein n=1 Tax=Castanea mollissima TaxID=60419 RepID=A0A8J4QPI6_9ROSI|nr:hypothetical protein CMV_025472 [Castanea mollissima]
MRLFQCTQCLVLVYAMAGLKIDEFSRAMMDATAKELIEEKSLAKSCLKEKRERRKTARPVEIGVHHAALPRLPPHRRSSSSPPPGWVRSACIQNDEHGDTFFYLGK